MRTASAVWRSSPDLLLALDDRFGAPVDSYVNGSQTWLLDNGPGGVTLEWRLHPVAAYQPPKGLSHYDLWERVIAQLRVGGDPSALALGEEVRAVESLWEGLEAFAAYGDEVEPATLAQAGTAALGRAPEAAGLVDHERIGDSWERAWGDVSIVDLLLEELRV
ncbi:MAG TPA: hypothetical protein VGO28_07030 [Acidimicrobiia bacterium]